MSLRSKVDYIEPAIPRLVPEPVNPSEYGACVICLDGEWDVEELKSDEEPAEKGLSCQKVMVPGDMTVLYKKGFAKYYQYHRQIDIPEGKEDARFVLRFEGVNGFAEVYLDGEHVASHQNGFITWNVEVTKQMAGKKQAGLTVVIDERCEKVSAYNHGGILHSVYLYILPECYIDTLTLKPLFSEDMESCTLRTDMDLSMYAGKAEESCEIYISLYDHNGHCVREMYLEADSNHEELYQDIVIKNITANIEITDPVLWDAEHPRLYTVAVSLYKNGVKMETVQKKTGLRKLTRIENRIFVNGQEIKLRGVCRHETSPYNGRTLTRELIEQDVILFKEANCNYIRTSHYPPSEYFLDLCDQYGLYVEDELALAFIARTLPYTQREPEQTQRYLSHFAETYARDNHHPSVIIWSLCNESFGGYNFDLLNRYAKKMDPERFTKFSYPMTIREEHEMPDIWSIHYSEYDEDLAMKRDNVGVGYAPGRDLPVLHDEYVHVACYNREEIRRDPNVRSFWGEGIRMFWDSVWNTEGALGGAIWAGIDETDIYYGGDTRLEWGIIDVWRRKKPEHYMTRKAYTPIKVISEEAVRKGGKISFIVENRFCHTNMSEVDIYWSYGEKTGYCKAMPDSASDYQKKVFGKPGAVIKIEIPLKETPVLRDKSYSAEDIIFPVIEKWDGESNENRMFIAFADSEGNQVEEVLLPVLCMTDGGEYMEPDQENMTSGQDSMASEQAAMDSEQAAMDTDTRRKVMDSRKGQEEDTLSVNNTGSSWIIGNSLFTMTFSAETGLLTDLSAGGERLLMGGPYLNVPYLQTGRWYRDSVNVEEKNGMVLVSITGGYENTMSLLWEISIKADGTFTTAYTILHLEKTLPKALKLRVGVDAGGLDELGVMYLAAPSMEFLTWRRKGYYSLYPADHISRNTGCANRYTSDHKFGIKPNNSWGQDMKSDILNGEYDTAYKGSNDFRSTKENIYEAYLGSKAGKVCIGAVSDGTHSVRAAVLDPEEEKIKDSDTRICYSGSWYQVDDRKESDHGSEMWSREKGAYAECKFTGTGIVWYGPQDTTYGKADVFIDGKCAAKGISQRVPGVDFSCSSVGYDKKYGYPVFSITDLPYGEHTIRISVCGEKAEDSSDYYVVIDYFRVLGESPTEQVALIINNDFAYPHIAWGNYRKPAILPGDGYTNEVVMRLKIEN